TDKLEDVVPYALRARIELRSLKPLKPGATEEEKNEQAQKNLIAIGTAMRLSQLAEERTDEMAGLLLRLAKHESPQMRQGVAEFVGAIAGNIAFFRGAKPDDPALFLLPARGPFGPDAKRETPQERARRLEKVVARFRELKLEAALERLREDPDAAVRSAAATALKQLAALK